MNTQLTHWIVCIAVLLSPMSLVGCGGPSFPVGEVEGIVLINGKPANDIFVQFIPEVAGEASPPPSNGKTDEQGHFVLNMMESGGAMRAGAAVGMHRVVLRVFQPDEPSTPGRPRVRLPTQFTMPSATPLTQEVKAGKQTVEIKIPPG